MGRARRGRRGCRLHRDGLHIFWQAFGYLRFGASTAMAWVLGAMLIGFTVVQLKRISRMEFRAAGSNA